MTDQKLALRLIKYPQYQWCNIQIGVRPLRAILPIPGAVTVGLIVAGYEVDNTLVSNQRALTVPGLVKVRLTAIDQVPVAAAIQSQPAVHGRYVGPARHRL